LRRDHVCAALGIGIAAAYWFAADAIPTSLLSDSVGAGGVPKAIALLLGVLACAVLFSKQRKVEKRDDLKALGIAALGFVYLAAAPLIGYFLSVAALAGGAALYYGAPRGIGVAVFALGTAALLWLVFSRILGIALP
jgi:putative tricarboxylic transport membrane protein